MRLLLFLFFVFTTAFGCDFSSSEEYRKRANKLEQQKKYKEAIILLDKVIRKDPDNIKALLDRGVDKSNLGDYGGAISDYSRVIEIDPDNTLAFLNRANNKYRLDSFIGAIEDYTKAIKTKGGEFLYMDKLENQFVETGFEFDVDMEEIKFGRALCYYEVDSLKKAFNDFSFCIQKNYNLPDSYYWRGLIYLAFQDKKEGCQDLATSRKLKFPDAQEMIYKYCK